MRQDSFRFFEKVPTTEQAKLLLQEMAAIPSYDEPSAITKPVYLYGAGSLGRMAWDYFKKVGVDVLGVIDKAADQARKDPFWRDARLMTPEEVSVDVKKDALLAMCIVAFPWGEVTEPLRVAGWQTIIPFYILCHAYKDQHPLDNGWLSGALSEDDVREMTYTLERYADDVSRAHCLQFAAWHTLLQEWVFKEAPVDVSNRYFIPEIVSKLHDHEVFLDIGAHHGSVISGFLERVRENFSSIVAIEGDSVNRRELELSLEKLPADCRAKIQVEPIVVGKEEGPAHFVSGLGYASRLVPSGGEEVLVQPLDGLNFAPTFIKAHLEGGELEALLGGLETIRRYRPMIALTVYHNRQGLWLTAKTLMQALERYRFIFRLHGWQGTGAVLYLVPEER